jgi:hypothetical protein
MRSIGLLAAALLGILFWVEAEASTEVPSVMEALFQNKRDQLFARVLRTSELTRDDLGQKFVTFLVPRDTTCTASDRAYLEGLTSKEAARRYVMSHVLVGELTSAQEDGRYSKVTYFPDKGTPENLAERVFIDEVHPLDAPLLDGKVLLVSLSGGAIRLGARSMALFDGYGPWDGSWIELDECAVL